MEIKTATDWQLIRSSLQKGIYENGHNPDLKKLLENINGLVSELSKLEVEARRTKSNTNVKKQVEIINTSIKHLEALLMMARLLK